MFKDLGKTLARPFKIFRKKTPEEKILSVMKKTKLKGKPKEAFTMEEIKALVRERFGEMGSSTLFFALLDLINQGRVGSEKGLKEPGTEAGYTMVFFLENTA